MADQLEQIAATEGMDVLHIAIPVSWAVKPDILSQAVGAMARTVAEQEVLKRHPEGGSR